MKPKPKALTREELDLFRLWRERPEENRTADDVLIFYNWLQQNRPDLIPKVRRMDPYQRLKGILINNIKHR